MNEQISALLDGELNEDETATVIAKLKQDNTLEQDWLLYNIIGDAYRQTTVSSLHFERRFAARLAQEPTVLAPGAIHSEKKRPIVVWSAAASIAVISLVSWLTLNNNVATTPGGSTQLDNVRTVSLATDDERNRLKPYLLAHEEFSSSLDVRESPTQSRPISDSQTDVQ